MSTIFICHSSADKPFARRLTKELERRGVRVWIDEREIGAGQSLTETIQAGLERSDYVIVVLTAASLRRPWVKKELSSALTLEFEREQTVVLPALLRTASLPLFLRDKKYADFRRDFDAGLQDILGVVRRGRGPGRLVSVETVSCEVFLDIRRLDGSLVHYRKTQVLRALAEDVSMYVEAFSTDGEIGHFKVTPGRIDKVWSQAGTIYVRTKFPRTLSLGQTLKRTMTCSWRDSFTSDVEYWEERQHHQTGSVAIKVQFPIGRPPTRWETVEREGSTERRCQWEAKLQKLAKPTLCLNIESPRMFDNYVLRWWW